MGWFTLGAPTGPEPHIIPIHSRISELYTESPLLVLFHPESAFTEATAAGKLPLTVYESISVAAASDPNDKAMDIDGAVQAKSTKFRELVYSIETGEAEMISVDFVARGGGNATAVEGSADAQVVGDSEARTDEGTAVKISPGKQKGKEKDAEKEAQIDETAVLTAEDDESRFTEDAAGFKQILTGASSLVTHSQNKRYTHAWSTYCAVAYIFTDTSAFVSLRLFTSATIYSRCTAILALGSLDSP